MKRLIKTCLALTVFGVGLSSPLNASNVITETVDDTGKVVNTALFGWNDWKGDYLLEDMETGATTRLDGVPQGVKLDDPYYITKDFSPFKGDLLKDLNTGRSGIITGVKDQGTMDVMTSNGRMQRYEYVVFKVKNVKSSCYK